MHGNNLKGRPPGAGAEKMNMFQLLEKTTGQYPNNLFLVREGVNYTDFVDLVKKRAAVLDGMGVKKGDVVGILAHNIPQFPTTLFAIWYLGAQCLLLDTNLTPFEYNNMAELTSCKIVFAENSFFFKTNKIKFVDITAPDGAANPDLKAAAVEASDIATLSFTSGSTGTPKVVPLTHFNLVECANSLEDMNRWINPGDVLYGFLPMYHVFGFAVEILATLHYGAGVLLQPTVNPKDIMDDFKTFRPHVIPAVPRLWEVFRNKIIDNIKSQKKWWLVSFVLKYGKSMKKIGLGFLVRKVQGQILGVFGGRAALLIAGGAATKPEVETFYERLGLTFIQGYGLTETVGPICISKPTKKRYPFAFGGPITNNECDIRDKNDDGVGVLWLRGHQVFGGYLDNPDVNAEVFDEKGFFNTGDMVSMDPNGELHFAGRKKQVIVLDSGKNVYPDELEGLYITIPGVKNVAVFEHKVKNKTVSYAVFSVDDKMTVNELASAVASANKKVASYKWVTHFAMTTEDLPLTSTQKVRHHVVRDKLVAGDYPTRKE
ncbi:MAG: AMP-binding protein [Rickettsiales bacterium]|jgi:long-chain acyl-CoA synthetase|nr:AMP-binding protein [Rickettsiales bacterium]